MKSQKLFKVLLLIAFLFLSFSSFAEILPNLSKDGKIRFYVYHNDEFLEIQYLNEKKEWIEGAQQKFNHLLRSRDDDKVKEIDKRLVELADHLQDHFKVDTIEVISGFRSVEFNNKLKSEGHNVARESFHTKGQAMDIHIDEINETAIRDYLLQKKLGGVGYYGKHLMIHMDFGPVRQWQDSSFREATNVGIFNKESVVQIRTDKFYYSYNSDEKISFQIQNLTNLSDAIKKMKIQKFHRGKWKTISIPLEVVSSQSSQSLSVPVMRYFRYPNKQEFTSYGKFRLRYEDGKTWQNSNEFYVKREFY